MSLHLTDEDRAWLESALDNWSHTTRIPASKMAEQVALHFLRGGIERGRREGIEQAVQLGEPMTVNRNDDPLANSFDGGIRTYIEAIRALLKE